MATTTKTIQEKPPCLDASEQCLDVGVGHRHAGEEGDVREGVVSGVEADLGVGGVPERLELLLQRGPARRAKVQDEGSSLGLVQVRVMNMGNEPVGGNLKAETGT